MHQAQRHDYLHKTRTKRHAVSQTLVIAARASDSESFQMPSTASSRSCVSYAVVSAHSISSCRQERNICQDQSFVWQVSAP